MSDYEFDIFVSYRNRVEVADWVRRVLVPHTRTELSNQKRGNPRIFYDTEATPGTSISENVRHALLRSRCMIAVLEPQYFTSGWCLSELYSMLGRHRQLVVPVWYSDGDSFDPEIADLVRVDMRPHVHRTHAAAGRHQGFLDVRHQLGAAVLAAMAEAPSWAPDFIWEPHSDRSSTFQFMGMRL